MSAPISMKYLHDMFESISTTKLIKRYFGFSFLPVILIVIFSLYIYNLIEFSKLFSSPFSNVDYFWHYYHFFLYKNSDLHLLDNSLYSPFFMAGYPLLFPPGDGLFAIIIRLIPDISLTAFFNVVALITIVITPFIFLLATKMMIDFDELAKSMLFFFCMCIYILKMFFFVNIGMFSYALSTTICFFIIIFISAIIHTENFNKKKVVIIAMLTSLAVLIHQYAIIILFLPISIFFMLQIKKPKVFFTNLALFIIIVVTLNINWMYSFIVHGALTPFIKTNYNIPKMGGMIGAESFKNASYYVSLFFIPITFASVYICKKFKLISNRILLYYFVIYLYYTFLGFYGNHIGLFEPIRMRELGIYISAIFLIYLIRQQKINELTINSLARIICFFAIVIFFSGVCYYAIEYRYGNMGPRPISETDEGKMAAFLLENGVNSKGRVLIEAKAIKEGEVIGSVYFTSGRAILPLLIGTEVIGGPAPSLSAFSDYSTGYIFQRKIEDIDPKDFIKYMELYNIKWLVAITRESRAYFDSHPQYFDKVSMKSNIYANKVIELYKISSSIVANYFIKGNGDISAGVNFIKLSNVNGREIIIKYHWFDTAYSITDGVTIEPVYYMDDPVPFIKINNPAEKREIFVKF